MAETFKDRMKQLRRRAGFKSQMEAAEAIGCERGTVGMWEAPSSAVDSVSGDYLLDVARAYQVRPEYINTGKGDDGFPWSSGADAAMPSRSQSVRLDPVMLSQTYKALLSLEPEADHPLSLANLDDAAHFMQVYEMRAAMPAVPSDEEWIEFGRKLATLTPTGGDDGRGGGLMPTEGSHKSKVAGKVRRKG